MSTQEEVLVAENNGIVTLTLNRPEKRNAMHGALIANLLHHLKEIAADRKTRVLIINGNGEHFCAGADINWMQQIASGPKNENYHDAQRLADLMYQLYHFPKPSIVLAHGMTLGGGLGLVSVCDIALATPDAKFAFSEVKIGIAPSVISPYVLSAIGGRAASYYFLTGETFTADEAMRLGLIHRCIPNQELIASGNQLAQMLLKNSPHAMHEAKQLIRHVVGEKITATLSHMTAEHLANLRSTPQAQEGLKAFMEKRNPHWE